MLRQQCFRVICFRQYHIVSAKIQACRGRGQDVVNLKLSAQKSRQLASLRGGIRILIDKKARTEAMGIPCRRRVTNTLIVGEDKHRR